MTLVTQKYARKPFYIDAVQVTPANMEEVAQWCNGTLQIDDKSVMYIQVRVHRPMNERQTKAYVNDWVLYAGTGYKVYSPKAFNNSFEQADDGPYIPKPVPRPGPKQQTVLPTVSVPSVHPIGDGGPKSDTLWGQPVEEEMPVPNANSLAGRSFENNE